MDGENGVYRASSSANVVLYVGLGMVAIGLVITFVGLGDKGFRLVEDLWIDTNTQPSPTCFLTYRISISER